MSAIRSQSELVDALKEAGVPQRAIANRLALAPSAVSNIFSGNRTIKFEEALALLDMLPAQATGQELPLIGMAGAGKWLEAVEVTRRHVWLPPELHGRFAVEVVGDSMDLLLPDGSIAIVDPDDTGVYTGRLYLLRNSEGEGTIKRYRAEPARFEPVSSNPEHQPFELGSIDFQIIGRVTSALQIF